MDKMGTKTASDMPERLHALDAVRGFALLLGVAFHAALAFLPGPQAWLVMEQSRSDVIALLAYPLHMFRLTTFFLIAGFFGRLLIERSGASGFARNRAKRIAVPLVLFWPVVMFGIVAAMIWLGAMNAVPGQPPAPPPPFPTFPNFPLTHLWFLYALLLLYAGALLLRGLLGFVDRGGRVPELADRLVGGLASSPLAPLLLALPVLPALYGFKTWPMWFGIPTPDQSLIPNLPAAIAFGLAFLFGWLLHRQPRLFRRWSEVWPATLALALATTASALAIVGPTEVTKLPGQDTTSLLYYYCYAVGGWAWTMALIGLAVRYLSGHSPVRRYIADASYWVYIIHLPIVLLFQVGFSKSGLHWSLLFPLILAGSFAIAFATYHLLVRRSFLGALLNGRRYRRGTEATPGATAGGQLQEESSR